MEKKVKLLVPDFPAQIAMEVPGLDTNPAVSVSTLNEKEAKRYAKEMAAAWLKHWNESLGVDDAVLEDEE